jgi:hypothetical protein
LYEIMVIFFGKYAQRMGRRFAAGQRWGDEIRGKEVSGSRLAAPRREFREQKGYGRKDEGGGNAPIRGVSERDMQQSKLSRRSG